LEVELACEIYNLWVYRDELEITKIGDSNAIILPRELMQLLNLKTGQKFCVEALPKGGFQLLPCG
jgi:hypothetical protein